MVKQTLSILVSVVLLSACGNSGGVKAESAQDKRNNFDSCKITFLKQISEIEYKANQAVFDKQAEEACAPLLTSEESSIKDFVVPKPVADSKGSNKLDVTFSSVCEKIKKAAYAHREMTNYNDDAGDYYDKWYGKIRAYFRDAAALMRSMSGNYSGLIADAQSAATNARGVNGVLTYAEERLYVACKISVETVSEDFTKWLYAK